MSPRRNPIALYAQAGLDQPVLSVSTHKLISMLFNGAQIAILKAEQGLQAGDISGMKKQIETAIEIIDSGLRTSLQIRDGDREAKNLRALYLHMMRRLSEAKLSQDSGTLHEVYRLLSDLKSAWQGATPVSPVPVEIAYFASSAGRHWVNA